MKLTFLGAAREVTGSCYLLEAAGRRLLIDCGMVQGPDFHTSQRLQADPAGIDGVFLTHAHIDHAGNLPLLYKNGYSGPVYTSSASWHLAEIMLRDSAHIQETEAEWSNRKAARSGRPPVEPLYTADDAEGALSLFQGVAYGETFCPFDGLSVTYTDAGHLLGSASITFAVTEGETTRTVVFSGDIGNLDQPLIHDPAYLCEADYVVMESTYGSRAHPPQPDYIGELCSVLRRTFDRGGTVVVPSFAVGRTQELLYFLRRIKEERRLPEHGDFVVYVDSPLAIEATGIFLHTPESYYDREARELIRSGVNPIGFPGLLATRTSQESKEINFDRRKKVILSASGMCEAGRIRHHLKHNLWGEKNTVLFVGYQAEGTLGRKILDGEKRVRLFGEEIAVHAEILPLSGISAHADRDGLLRWIGSFSPKPRRVFVTHGSEESAESFTRLLQSEGYAAEAPFHGAVYDLLRGETVTAGRRRRPSPQPQRDAQFEKLRAAGEKLSGLIDSLRGSTHKEMQAAARDIHRLIDQYTRRP